MKTTHSFGVHFILRMNKVKNKRAPLYARVVVDGKRVEIALRKWIELDDWNDERGIARGSRDAARETNHFIEEVRARLMQCYRELQLQCQLITAEIIKNKYLGSDENEHTLYKLIEYHNANMNNSLAWGTQKNYFTTQKYIRLFLKNQRGTSDVYFVTGK